MNSEPHVKRPMNCFMVWSREKRYNILKEHPGINNAEVSKALGAAWRKLSEKDKEPYVEEARRLNEQHKVENPGYKYQPKRRNSKRSKRKLEKKNTTSAPHCTKIHTRKTTGGNIHLPFKIMPDPEEQQLNKLDGRPLFWIPSHSGSRCFLPPGFQPSPAGFCSCHVFYTASPCQPSWVFESVGTSNHFYKVSGASRLRPYGVQEDSQSSFRNVDPFFRHCKL